MLRLFSPLVAVFLWLTAAQAFAAPITVTDATGQTVSLKDLPKRIVSLSPHATELMFAAGGGDRLVATSSFSDYPEAAKELPVIGGYNSISVESIIALHPDLVLFWPTGNNPDIETQLNNFGIPVYHSELRSIGDIASELRNLGALSGSDQGAKVADELLTGWNELEATYGKKKTVPVFLEVWNNPLKTLNGDHMVSQLFRVCGAENIFADAPMLVPTISREEVIARKPHIILEGDHGDRLTTDTLYQEWKLFDSIPAVQNKAVYSLDGGILLRPTPRILQGARAFCEKADQARTLM
ncbi:cobalamin-binding protein [Parendozoicomonas haliclonae]|uniref:Vitamin B12-binding protein n=1 Tax=Parendozoicomonas haliclonae TaxID=1960125 RepID=A0A1X7ALZ1_9GAMM|nr:cobalamin-binding protein [Parendozoicomonas haliclonae]SMA49111.1 Vitamin B12-binding protein precursor [Parendozoicomonas haliclonae]